MFQTIADFFTAYPWATATTAAAIALIGTCLTIVSQRAINRRRATVEMLTTKMWDNDYIATLEHFFSVMRNQERLMVDYDLYLKHGDSGNGEPNPNLSAEQNERIEDARSSLFKIRYVLNDRELVAIGIREGIYDEAIYRRLWYSTTLTEWKMAGPLVARIRTSTSSRAYVEFEALARRWETQGPWTPKFSTFNVFGRVFTVIRSR